MNTRKRTDGILRTKFREIILTDRQKGCVRGIFWAHTPFEARHFARNMRRLGFAARLRRAQGNKDQHITYVIGNWSHV